MWMNKKKSLVDLIADTKLIHILLAIVIGFVVGALFMVLMKVNVASAYGKLFGSIFSGIRNISYCIVYATPYIAVGLSVAFSFKTGVFNIGAEGQFVMGAISACCVGILLGDLPSFILIPLCFVVSMAAGALWGAIVGILKTKWGINEVLSMIMFNWIAFYLSNYIAIRPGIANEGSSTATQQISDNARTLLREEVIKDLGLAPTANWGIFVAIVLTILVWYIIEKTTLGYELKAVGFNKNAAEYAGINVKRSILSALGISGAMAGLAGALHLMGMGGRVSVFVGQEGFGFAGIVVALIGMNNPFGVLLAGLFYGALKYGGSKLTLVGAYSEVVDIIVGTVVFFIAISGIFSYVRKLKKEEK